MPNPVTRTDVAFALDHVRVAVPPTFIAVGETLIAAVTPVPALTVTVAVRVIGPPLPCAVSVNVWVPAVSPVTFCVPLAAVVATPGPLTKTEVALAVLHVSEDAPGAVAVVGEALIEPDTVGNGAPTVNVAVRVIGPPGPWAVSVKVCVPAARPLTVWVPVPAALERLGPDTATEVAFAVVHETVVEAGAVPVVGLTAIEPDTAVGAATVTVAVCEAGPFGPCAVMM